MSLDFYTLTLSNIEPLTPNAARLTFALPQAHKHLFTFLPGQHVSIRPNIPDQVLSRPYSICELKADYLQVVVKRVKQGIVSNYIHDHFKIGRSVEMTLPKGKYFFDPKLHAKPLLLVATGSGITPIYSIIQAALAQDANRKIILLYGNSTREETIFLSEIEDLSIKHPSFKVHFFFSQEGQRQRIDAKAIQALKEQWTDAYIYLCGVPEMMDTVKQVLLEQGLSEERIFRESFIKKPVPKTETEPTPKTSLKSKVKVIIDKTSTEFELEYEGKSILETANALGADLPYSCLGGICCTCRAKLIEGKVEMKENLALDVNEERNGYILCCQSHPRSERVVISFDI
jgi:ring-1,2-phenylacetyl-CoA epoxidase subunit PaaE